MCEGRRGLWVQGCNRTEADGMQLVPAMFKVTNNHGEEVQDGYAVFPSLRAQRWMNSFEDYQEVALFDACEG